MKKIKYPSLLLTLILFCLQAFAQQPVKAKKTFSDAVQAGGLLFVSGQLGLNSVVQGKDAFRDEVWNALGNVEMILKKNGLSLKHVVNVTVYLKNLEQFDVFNEIYMQQFSEPFPARTCVIVKDLVKQANIEVSVVASTP
ncbi:2-iminobutanoate/2-iminopropanoate deaminase [Pedobacter sp. W3I1]|uniref:RidA family protein n=1 Tax=Pedobacter sp. W3I1 TaxID=3042291 RepID=UPI002782FC65|nr:RidA family protein [Pedobacter sp. W3I1]MDQ0640251.1 2-iminobutanoate/2-iminopropanoate deaminase [Pedobacter sp. W3I1]